MIDKLTAVDCNGKLYLCEINETESKVELLNACLWEKTTDDQAVMIKWITKHNLGELQTVRLGTNTGYAVNPLNEKQKIQFRHLWNSMQETKRTAIHRLENQYFTEDEE